MKIVLKQEKLSDCLKAVAVIADEPTFTFDENGMSIRTMDPSRVCMIDFLLEKSAFEVFQPDLTGEPGRITFNITEMMKIMRRCKKEDKVTLTFQDKIIVDITGNYHRVFKIPPLESLDEETPIPKVSFRGEAKLAALGLQSCLEDAQAVSDHVRFTLTNDKLNMRAAGDITSANIDLQVGDDVLLDSKNSETEAVRATFSLSYLADIVKTVRFSEIVNVSFSTDMPIKLSFESEYPGKLDYYLAPRIEVE